MSTATAVAGLAMLLAASISNAQSGKKNQRTTRISTCCKDKVAPYSITDIFMSISAYNNPTAGTPNGPIIISIWRGVERAIISSIDV